MTLNEYSKLPHKELSSLLCKKKEDLGLKSVDFASELGMTRSAISQIEHGKLRVPQRKLVDFMEFYQINSDELGSIDPGFLLALNEIIEGQGVLAKRVNDVVITKEDVEWLLQIYRDLARPMTLSQISGLLKLRH